MKNEKYLTQPGMHYVYCDRCAAKMRERDTKKTWDNLIVCTKTCWEPRPEQDILPAPRKQREPRVKRSEPEDNFRTTQVQPSDL